MYVLLHPEEFVSFCPEPLFVLLFSTPRVCHPGQQRLDSCRVVSLRNSVGFQKLHATHYKKTSMRLRCISLVYFRVHPFACGMNPVPVFFGIMMESYRRVPYSSSNFRSFHSSWLPLLLSSEFLYLCGASIDIVVVENLRVPDAEVD